MKETPNRNTNTDNNLNNKEEQHWADITVDINDGWADDVSLIYPEGSWRPDEGELTKVEIEPIKKKKKRKLSKKSSSLHSANNNSTSLTTKEIAVDPTLIQTKKNKTHPFRMFLIIWLGLLSITIAVLLGHFYDFLVDYEDVYQLSRPYHLMDDIIQVFNDGDINNIYQMMDLAPEITEFETQENVKAYIAKLLEGVRFAYTPTGNYMDDFPEYYITANDYIIATVSLRKNPNEYLAYGFPIWYVASFDFYTEAQYSCRIISPNNSKVYLNGVEISDDYLYQRAILVENKDYFLEYAEMPTFHKYECTGMYEQPEITAKNCFGEDVPVYFNPSTGLYEVGFGNPSQELDTEMKELATSLACTYANYISHDEDDNALDEYFVPDSTILQMIKSGAAKNYFSSHTTPVIDDIEIIRFTAYSENMFLCEVSLNQYMNVYSHPEVVNTDLTFFFVNTEDGYKCCNIQY